VFKLELEIELGKLIRFHNIQKENHKNAYGSNKIIQVATSGKSELKILKLQTYIFTELYNNNPDLRINHLKRVVKKTTRINLIKYTTI